MSAEQLALTKGLRETRATLDGWSEQPLRIVGRWVVLSLVVTAGLLYSIYVVAKFSTPEVAYFRIPGINRPAADWNDAGRILYRNLLVLALHAMVCVAVFIATSSLPQVAHGMSGTWRWIHDKAGSVTLVFVTLATLFSLLTQAWALGAGTADLAYQLGTRPSYLLLTLLPHALPELTAIFLPLAACLIATARNTTHELLAATFVSVCLAVPTLLAAATIEVYLTPLLLSNLTGA